MPVISIRPISTAGGAEGAELGFAFGGPMGAAAGAFAGEVADAEVEVTFSCRDGSVRVYRYEGAEARAILAGSNPSDYSGRRVG